MQTFKVSNCDDKKIISDSIQKVTKIIPAVKTTGRYNIFINNKFSFSLDEVQLVGFGLKKGQEIDEKTLKKYKTESDFGKNYIRAVDLISRRIRSEKELRDYAFRKSWSKENLEKVIERLYEHRLLDDEKFAESFVRSRANLRNFSIQKMKFELIKKGITNEIIEKVLHRNEDFDEDESLKKMIVKKRRNYDDERKLVAYLARQGFPYDKIRKALDEE